jgi:hypothetical protein
MKMAIKVLGDTYGLKVVGFIVLSRINGKNL